LTGTGNQSIGFVVNGSTSLTGTSIPGESNNNVDFNTGVNLPIGSVGGWTHLAAVYVPGTSMSVYMNGVSIGEKTTGVPETSPFDGSAPLWIGRQFSGSTSTAFEGLIDEVALYGEALTPAQIAAHYAAAATDTPLSSEWGLNGSGTWHSSANWSPSADYVPSGPQFSINFGAVITAPKVVYTETNVIAKSIRFENANKYVIAGVGSVSLTAPSGSASVQVVNGAHEFQTAVSLGSNTDINVAAGAGNSISFNNALTLNAKTLNIASGIVNINHSVAAGTGGAGVIVNAAGATLGTAGATPIAATFTNVGTLDIDLGGTETNQFSAFNITGTATLSGFVSPELVNGFTPASGNTFTILTATNLIDSGIALAGPLASSFSLSVVGGDSLVLTAVGLAGDFNHDNKVDAADYVVWRKGLGTTHVQGDYDVWRSNFGAVGAGSGSGVELGAAVPEPTSLALFAAVCSLSIGMRRGFRR